MRHGAVRPMVGLVVAPLAVAVMAASHSPPRVDACGGQLRALLTSGMDSLALALDSLQLAAEAAARSHGDTSRVALRLGLTRLVYKSVEGLLEHFDGATASILNGREAEAPDEDGQSGPLKVVPPSKRTVSPGRSCERSTRCTVRHASLIDLPVRVSSPPART